MKQYYEFGGLWRADFKRLCLKLDVDYKEERGWLGSSFLVDATPEQLSYINTFMNRIDDIKKRAHKEAYGE